MTHSEKFWTIGIILTIALTLIGIFWAWPVYRVWQRELSGQAALAEAEWSRQIAVREAQAVLDSSDLLRQAEIIRAQGVAEANLIIGESLQNNEAYLRYLFVNQLADTENQIIYVPTEAQLPILEAGRALEQ